MNFSECNPIVLLSVIGVIIIGVVLVLCHQDGFLLKAVLVILAGTAGLAVEVPQILKGGKKES